MDLKKEKRLIKKAKTNDEAFSKIYELHYDKIFSYILKRVIIMQIAQDITSEVFLKAFKNIWSFQFRQISFSSWLYRIATNEINNYFKRKSYHTVSLDHLLELKGFEPSHNQTPQAELLLQEKLNANNRDFFLVQQSIRKLPLEVQTIINLKIFEQKTYKEISQIMSKKENTIKSLFSRGLAKLKKHLEVQALQGKYNRY